MLVKNYMDTYFGFSKWCLFIEIRCSVWVGLRVCVILLHLSKSSVNSGRQTFLANTVLSTDESLDNIFFLSVPKNILDLYVLDQKGKKHFPKISLLFWCKTYGSKIFCDFRKKKLSELLSVWQHCQTTNTTTGWQNANLPSTICRSFCAHKQFS